MEINAWLQVPINVMQLLIFLPKECYKTGNIMCIFLLIL